MCCGGMWFWGGTIVGDTQWMWGTHLSVAPMWGSMGEDPYVGEGGREEPRGGGELYMGVCGCGGTQLWGGDPMDMGGPNGWGWHSCGVQSGDTFVGGTTGRGNPTWGCGVLGGRNCGWDPMGMGDPFGGCTRLDFNGAEEPWGGGT